MFCKQCGREIIPVRNYKFPRIHFKEYGDLINSHHNIEESCYEHRTRWTEIQFCDALNIEPISEDGKIIYKQFKEKGCCS